MALKGYIESSTYTSISNIIYEKVNNRCTALLTIYKDSTKKVVLGNHSISVEGSSFIPSLVSVNAVKNITNAGSSYFIISDDAEGELKGFEGRLGRVRADGGFDTFLLGQGGFLFYVEDEQKYRALEGDQWVEKDDVCVDQRVWEKWFSDAMSDGNNPTQQMYKFMKTLPLFKNCEDC